MNRRFLLFALVLILILGKAPLQADQILQHEAIVPAPVEEVWKAFATTDGLKSWAAPVADIDLRVGGLWRSHYDPNGKLGDDNSIANEILSYAPMKMLSIRNVKAPATFPFKNVIKNTWSVIMFESLGADRTRVTIHGMGYTDDPESKQMYAFFQAGNQSVLDALVKKFSSGTEPQNNQRVMELLKTLVGGEWISENKRPDGTIFRVRNVARFGPDGKSIVSDGWLGDAEGMFHHGSTLIHRSPSSQGGGVEFSSVNESGNVARGTISLVDEQTLFWDWRATDLEGKTTAYRVETRVLGPDSYEFKLFIPGPDGKLTLGPNVTYKRVTQSPEEFRRLKGK